MDVIKRVILGLCIAWIKLFSLQAENGIIEFRPSYFYPVSSSFRQIFHDGGVNYQLTAAFPVYGGEHRWLRGIDIWGAVDYFSREGRSTGLYNKTSICIVPLTLGIKYFFPPLGQTVQLHFYVAGGMI